MARVVGIDHISIRVSDFEKSKAFYSGLFAFLGFKVMDESGGDAIGWSNGKTRYWIGQADAQGRKQSTASARLDCIIMRFNYATARTSTI